MPKVTATSKLYNHSERLTVSHQISSSSGSTSTGRHHATYTTTSINVPNAPDPDNAMDVDVPYFDHSEPHTEVRQEVIAELPGVTVNAKQRAKRYENSVTYISFGWLLH
jgi:hypothetical protein